jgi:hydrogenase maturation protease
MNQVDSAPILVLGLGNLLLGDDAAGLRLVERLAAESGYGDQVEFVDGGTQGMALLGCLTGRKAVLLLDATGLGGAPGTVHVLDGPAIEALAAKRASTAHEGNALELLAAARLLQAVDGDAAPEIRLVGIEPARIATGIGLSPEVEAAMDSAIVRARAEIEKLHLWGS